MADQVGKDITSVADVFGVIPLAISTLAVFILRLLSLVNDSHDLTWIKGDSSGLAIGAIVGSCSGILNGKKTNLERFEDFQVALASRLCLGLEFRRSRRGRRYHPHLLSSTTTATTRSQDACKVEPLSPSTRRHRRRRYSFRIFAYHVSELLAARRAHGAVLVPDELSRGQHGSAPRRRQGRDGQTSLLSHCADRSPTQRFLAFSQVFADPS